jgi:hypothetical protein
MRRQLTAACPLFSKSDRGAALPRIDATCQLQTFLKGRTVRPEEGAMSDAIKESFSQEELQAIKVGLTDGRPYVDRISFALAVRLFEMRSDLREQALVIDELDVLEGLRPPLQTKAAKQFKHALYPLWHKHFSAPRHAKRNIGNRWNIRGTNQKALDAMISRVAAKYGADPEVWQRMFAHRFVLDGYADRATNQRLTGDWIIFGKHDGANYYLDLATHEEGRQPERLLEKLRAGSAADFPFLFRPNIADEGCGKSMTVQGPVILLDDKKRT